MRRKFAEAAWRALIYAFACAWAARASLLGDEELPWLGDSELFWKGWPHHEVSDGMASIYVLYVGLYVHQLLFLFLDIKTSDFVALIAHHVITLALVLGSWKYKFTRVGSFVMLLHDFSDIFLEGAKCFNYSQKHIPALSTGADVAFVVFALSFFYLRLYIYPTRVLSSMLEPSRGPCTHCGCFTTTFDACKHVVVYRLFALLLGALQLLQIFWGWKVLGVVVTVVRGKPLEDPRDD